MVQKTLSDMKILVEKYAETIANVIGVDVEVVDYHLERIAGTGIYKKYIGKDILMKGIFIKKF